MGRSVSLDWDIFEPYLQKSLPYRCVGFVRGNARHEMMGEAWLPMCGSLWSGSWSSVYRSRSAWGRDSSNEEPTISWIGWSDPPGLAQSALGQTLGRRMSRRL